MINNETKNKNKIIENDLEQGSEFEIPPGYIKVMSQQFAVDSLFKWHKKNKLIFPDFQRGPVWKKDKKESLIDSVLLKMPIPSLTFFELPNQNFEVIDGLQRLTTIFDFIEENPKNEIKYKNKKYKDLSDFEKDSIGDYSFHVSLFLFEKNEKELEIETTNKIKYDIFKRINKGSEILTNQEVRNAVYSSPNLKKIVNFTKTTPFYSLIINDSKFKYDAPENRKPQDEFLIRLLSYSDWYFNKEKYKFKNKKEDFLNFFMENVNKNIINIDLLLENATEILDKINTINKSSFYSLSRNKRYEEESNKIMETFSEALFIYFQTVKDNNFPTEIDIKNAKYKIFVEYQDDKNKFKEFFQSTTSIKSIKNRVEILNSFFSKK